MESTTIIVPSSSASSIDSNDGPIELSSDADSGGNTNSGGAAANRKKRLMSSSVVSNHGPVSLPSDDNDITNHGPDALPSDDDVVVLDETTRKKRMRPEPIYTCWSFGDERTMLMELAAARRETGRVPSPSELFRTLESKGVLLNRTRRVISSKFYNLKNKFIEAINNGGPGDKSHDKKIYKLSKEVWPLEELRKEGKLI